MIQDFYQLFIINVYSKDWNRISALCTIPTIAHGRTFDGFFCNKTARTCITQGQLWLTCDPGYVISGFGYMICNGGQWDRPTPTCTGKPSATSDTH